MRKKTKKIKKVFKKEKKKEKQSFVIKTKHKQKITIEP